MSKLLSQISAYQTLHSLTDASSAVDTDLAAATGYGIGPPSGAVNLVGTSGAADNAEANAVVLVVKAATAANGDTLTQKLYGIASGGGPPQLIASIVWTIGTARADGATATLLWADTAVVTSTHLTSVLSADADGGDRVASVMFDATGYRYLYGLFTAQTGDPTVCTCLYRYY